MKKELTLREVIGMAIGEASMCWSEIPTGTFDSVRAERIVNDLVEYIERKGHLESLISGHIEAMRPLLNEWSKLK